MVRGLELFMNHFQNFTDHFVLIGGTACDLALRHRGSRFRATKDIDIVLCAEVLTRPFVEALWEFIREGNYKVQETSTGQRRFYRFSKPQREEFPFMLEFFSKMPDALDTDKTRYLAPIPVEDRVVSLSAILLDEEYYAWILQGKQMLDGAPIAAPEHLIPLKAKAWLDLTERNLKGEHVDSREIRKHKNDVFRLLAVVIPDTIREAPESIKVDLRKFLDAMNAEDIDFKNFGLGERTKEEVFKFMRTEYRL